MTLRFLAHACFRFGTTRFTAFHAGATTYPTSGINAPPITSPTTPAPAAETIHSTAADATGIARAVATAASWITCSRP